MHPAPPDRHDADTVLAIHRHVIEHGRPPSITELARAMGIPRQRAHAWAQRATLHGWLRRLMRATRNYVPVWYPMDPDWPKIVMPPKQDTDDDPEVDPIVLLPTGTLRHLTACVSEHEALAIAMCAEADGVTASKWLRKIAREALSRRGYEMAR